MAFALSRSYVAACGLWGMGVWEWRVEGVAGLIGFSNWRKGTAEGKFAPTYFFHRVLCAGMAVCLCVRICVGAHMLTRTRARKKPDFFSQPWVL